MAVRKLPVTAGTLDDLIQADGVAGLVGTWAQQDLEPTMRSAKFRLDTLFTSVHPVVVNYKREGDAKAAQAIVDVLATRFGVQFQTGVQNAYSPFVKLTRRFTPFPGVFGYFVVSLGTSLSGKGVLTVKFTT